MPSLRCSYAMAGGSSIRAPLHLQLGLCWDSQPRLPSSEAQSHAGRWQYSVSMPTVAGVGLAPLAQWIVVPLLLVAVSRAASSRDPTA